MALQPPSFESTHWQRNVFTDAADAVDCVDFEVMRLYEGNYLRCDGSRLLIATPSLPLLRTVGANKLRQMHGEEAPRQVFRSVSAKIQAHSQQQPELLATHQFATHRLNAWFSEHTPSQLDDFGIILLADMDAYGQSDGAIAANNRAWQDIGASCLEFMRTGVEVLDFNEDPEN